MAFRDGAERQHQPQEEAVEAGRADSWTLDAGRCPHSSLSSAEIQTFGTFIRPAAVCSSVDCLEERFVGDIIWFVGQFADRLTIVSFCFRLTLHTR